MKKYQFYYKGKFYECGGEDRDLQIKNFKHLIEIQDWGTLKNRVKNQLKFGGISEVIEGGTFTPTIEPSRTESVDSDTKTDMNGTSKKTFW